MIQANGQKKYGIKGTDIAFTSPDDFVELYNNPDYALYKIPRIQVSIKLESNIKDADLMNELDQKVNDKLYNNIEKGILHETTNQTGIFYWASKKNKTENYAIGYINLINTQKTYYIEITYDTKTPEKAEKIVKSFFTGDPINHTLTVTTEESANQSTKPIKKESETSGKQKYDTETTKPLIDQTSSESKNNQQSTIEEQKASQTADEDKSAEANQTKYPVVENPNLVKLTPAQIQEFLDAHNRWRSQVGVPPLKWSTDLENFAADWAVTKGEEGCNMEHRNPNEFGENLYWCGGAAFSPTDVVDLWGSEINDYHGEVVGQSNAVVGHYTQVVWKKTTEVGCACFKCSDSFLVVCNYNPPGNYVGQHPYK